MAQPAQAPRPVVAPRITRGKRVDRPLKVVLYGDPGVGKSTFASDAPEPIFIPTEDGTDQLDVARFERPATLTEVLGYLEWLATAEHPHKTVVLDTAGGIERLVWAHVCKAASKSNIEEFGYGKGYVAAIDGWRLVLAALERCQKEKSLHVVILDHAAARNHKRPDTDQFKRWRMNVDERAADLIVGWADAVLFATFEVTAVKREGRMRGVGEDVRVMRTVNNAAWDAKNRFNLEPELELSWGAFLAGVLDAKAIRTRCLELLAQLPADKQPLASKALSDAGDDPGKLAGLLNRLTLTVTPTTTETTKDTDK